MAQIYDSLKALMSSEMISKASALLGEKESNVSSAVSSLTPSFLGALINKGDTPQVKSVLEDAGRSSILSDIGNIFSGKMTDEHQGIGNRLIQTLMGDRASNLTSGVAASSGVSPASSGKLATIVAAVTSAFLGNRMSTNNMSLSGLLGQLNREKSGFMGLIPSGLRDKIGLSSLYGGGGASGSSQKMKKNSNWLTWVIVIIILLLLFFWWRSCRHRTTISQVERGTKEMVDTVAQKAARAVEGTVRKISSEIALPNGVKLTAFEEGTEQQIISYLNSDAFKNATAANIRERWFELDHITFMHNSETDLKEGNFNQVDNLAAILKYYTDAKIKIRGFADKTGTEGENLKISKGRADYIKSLLVSRGISSARISTEGAGERMATHGASSPDSERERDRHVAVSFMK